MPSDSEILCATPWLALKNVFPSSREGGKPWTYATRPGCSGGVCVIAIRAGSPPEILLVRQYRPPAGRHVIEFPAGLMDAGETPAQTALRELKEETGWEGTIQHCGPATYSSAGLTDEIIHTVTVQLTQQGDSHPDEEESIEILLWPLHRLREKLESAAAAGDGIDAKLWTYAFALPA